MGYGLKRTSLGVEEVDDREERGVEKSENEVGSPANVGNHNGSDHD